MSEPTKSTVGADPEGGGTRTPTVLHVLAVSHPHLNGYTVRSRSLIGAQRASGSARPVVLTSPFYPGNPASLHDEIVDGIPHRRSPHPSDMPERAPRAKVAAALYRLRMSGRGWLRGGPVHRIVNRLRFGVRFLRDRYVRRDPEAMARPVRPLRLALVPVVVLFASPILLPVVALYGVVRLLGRPFARALQGAEEALLLRQLESDVERVAREVDADVIHAHSPYRCGVPALRAARRMGLPFVYEVRGLWEESSVAAGRFREGDAKFRFWRAKETEAMCAADAVIGISEALCEEIADRGVARDRIFVVPNAVDPARFRAPRTEVPDGDRSFTLGYVGSLRSLEGVDELVRAAALLNSRGRDVRLLIVGDGTERDFLRDRAAALGISDRATFPGLVPHDEVGKYYAEIDAFVVSRPDYRVTRLVTPLKPLEAMAMGRAVVFSDLPALRELGTDGETALYYRPGDVAHLSDRCEELMDDPARREELARNARAWVVSERTWSRSASLLPAVYERAAAGRGGFPR